jgi:putative N6-adenine-specific DNA methylase
MSPEFALFAVCAPGLEPFTERELRRLGLARLSPVKGGVEFTGTLHDVYRANLHLHTASRVLVRLGQFHAREFWELHKRAARLPWEHHLALGQPVAIRATCHKSRLYHSEAVAERVARAIADRLGGPIVRHAAQDDDEAPAAQLIVVRLDHDDCQISVDSSGELLHRRGYRLATAKAPLRETLAAGLLMAAGWEAAAPLIDPFCGSGTIAIEAALLALGLPPGRGRRFAFMDWPGYDEASWRGLVGAAQAPSGRPAIIASDRDAGAVEAARANAERAGVVDAIEITCRSVSAIAPPPGMGWVITNPPYGMRVQGSRDLRDLYAAFGRVLRERFSGWRVALLCPDARLAAQVGLAFDETRTLKWVSGGLAVTLWQGQA